MKLFPITPPLARNITATQAMIYCVGDGCTARTTYGKGFEMGWHADANGVPFVSYYCPVCTRKLKGK